MAANKKQIRIKRASVKLGVPRDGRKTKVVVGASDLPVPRTLEEARLQTERLRAELTEITLKLKRGELIDKGANDKLRFREGRAVRDRFQALPPRIAAEVHGCEDVASTERLLMREIKSVLEGCADELS